MILIQRTGWRAAGPRIALNGFQALRRAWWRMTTPETRGSRGICLTPEGRLILVKHSYKRGWYLPGGAIDAGEDALSALLRELCEEIGMVRHGAARHLYDVRHNPDHKRDHQAVFLVEDVVIEPRLSLEIEAIGAFLPDALPSDLHPATRYRVERWRTGETEGSAPVPSE